MTRKILLGNGASINNLAHNLSKSNKVNAFDKGDYKESGTLAAGFSDLEKSFNIFLEVYLPKLMANDIKPQEVDDLLFDIGQEFNHILYHIKEPKYFCSILYDDAN